MSEFEQLVWDYLQVIAGIRHYEYEHDRPMWWLDDRLWESYQDDIAIADTIGGMFQGYIDTGEMAVADLRRVLGGMSTLLGFSIPVTYRAMPYDEQFLTVEVIEA